MHRGVRAPRTPALGAAHEIGGGRGASRAAQHDIRRRKGVGPVQRAHGDVLRGPWTDSRDSSELPVQDVHGGVLVDAHGAGSDVTREIANGFGARRENAQRAQIFRPMLRQVAPRSPASV